jgi:myo-inositol-1(or 4)-monophosphatase
MLEPPQGSLPAFSESRARLRHPVAEVGLAAAAAGVSALQDFHDRHVEVTEKGIGNFVTAADLASETAIVAVLRNAFPDHAIVAEESHRENAYADCVWIIDPLDGTNNFLHGIPHFAVSIGYYERGQGILGMIAQPTTGDWYVAQQGLGAWRNGRPISVSAASQLRDAMIGCGFYYDRGRRMRATFDTLIDLFGAGIHGMRRMGAAALDLAYLACGQFDGFFEYQLSPWDFAAGAVLVAEAGGQVSDCWGQPLPLDRISSLCASNGRLHAPLLETISPHQRQLQKIQRDGE